MKISRTAADGCKAIKGKLRWQPSGTLLIFGAWMLIATLISGSVLLETASSRPAATSVPPSVVRPVQIVLTFIEAFVWAGLTCVIFKLVDRFTTERYGPAARLGIFAGLGLLTVFTVAPAMRWLRESFNVAGPNHPLALISPTDITLQALIYAAVLIAGLARYYVHRYHERLAQATLLQVQLADARLTTLRAQLNPHFLFNTLHAISALVSSSPRGARRMISQLSELLRISLYEANTPETPLSRELAFVRRYLALMSVQLRSKIEVVEELEQPALNGWVPTLILQPLIENAIKHGISRLPEGGRLLIAARRSGDRLKLEIRNSVPTRSDVSSRNLGLRNTAERLQQLYGADYTFTAQLNPGSAREFVVEISLPFRESAPTQTWQEVVAPSAVPDPLHHAQSVGGRVKKRKT